jgi:hypothetical protein
MHELLNTNSSKGVISRDTLLQTGEMKILQYPGKERMCAIVIMDTLLKLSWHLVITDLLSKDTNYTKSPHVGGLPGQCSIALAAIQHAITHGIPVVRCDAVVAFPNICRHTMFDYIQKHESIYHRIFGLMNLIYGSRTYVTYFINGVAKRTFVQTTGSLQGCVSGGFGYTLGTLATSVKYASKMVQVVNDVHIIGLPPCFANATITSTPCVILGGFVCFPNNTQSQIRTAISPFIDKARMKFNSIVNHPTSKQNKLLILRSITWDYLVHLQHDSNAFDSGSRFEVNQQLIRNKEKQVNLVTRNYHVRQSVAITKNVVAQDLLTSSLNILGEKKRGLWLHVYDLQRSTAPAEECCCIPGQPRLRTLHSSMDSMETHRAAASIGGVRDALH